MRICKTRLIIILLLVFSFSGENLNAQYSRDTIYLRISIHVFQNDEGEGNFNADSLSHGKFLEDVINSLNHRLLNLDTLRPIGQSEFVGTTGLQFRVDSVFYHHDEYAWDCSLDIDSDYMRINYVDKDSSLNYKQKYQTLPVFLGGNYDVIGGHNNLLGDKGFIAMRGWYSEYQNRHYDGAVWDCARGLLHELGHSLGLSHNFTGGPNGNQCDECEDNGCPEEGTSNNIMDYWPSYGYALSACQMEIVAEHIKGNRGSISDIICNDSCYIESGKIHIIGEGQELVVKDTSYLHGDLIVSKGARLVVQGYLSFPDDKELIVEDGGELVLDGGTLGNLCGDLWKGIRFIREDSVGSQLGGIKLLSGKIENASRACFTNYSEMLSLQNVTFLNNELSLEILDGSAISKIEIDNCNFEIDGRINHWEEGRIPLLFVKITGQNDVGFYNCKFQNLEGHRTFDDLTSGIGLYIVNSNVKINNCSFNKLFKGIFARSKIDSGSVLIDSSYFELCHCGIELNGISRAGVSSSRIKLNRLNTMPAYGIYANDVGLLSIQNNTFTSDYGGGSLYGIFSNQGNSGTHFIYKNEFVDLGNGIINKRGSQIEWLSAIQNYSLEELYSLPLGTIWKSNVFNGVNVDILDIIQENHGLASAPNAGFQLFDIDKSKDFPLGGFGLFSRHQDFLAFTENNSLSSLTEDISFYTLSDRSWNSGPDIDLNEAELEYVKSVLIEQLAQGKELPYGGNPLSHEDLITLAEHLRLYPWLSVYPSFKKHIIDGVNIVPIWFWREVERALLIKDTWKVNLHGLMISLAKRQIYLGKALFTGNSIVRSENSLEDALLPILQEPKKELMKLNIGLVFDSPDPGFQILPNPNNGQFGVLLQRDFGSDENDLGLNFIIRSDDGRLLEQGKIILLSDLLLDVGHISSGLYLLEIWRGNEFLGMQKFIILPD